MGDPKSMGDWDAVLRGKTRIIKESGAKGDECRDLWFNSYS